MYTIHVDGKLLYQTGAEDEAQIALNVKPSLDIESAGSLSFVLPPGNAQYDAIRKMKSIITMHQSGRQIFRGRVTETERDIFNQKEVYCEGDKSFLLDSLWAEQIFQGKVQEFFRLVIDNHNEQVEEDKRFVVGIITAVDAQTPYESEFRVETRRYWDTSTVLDDKLLSVYGGYIRTRTEGDITYIDWLKDFEEESGQDIRFSVNLLDLKDKVDAKDVFTCLIPLGYSEIQDDGSYCDPVNIKSVNGGLDYIQNDAAVALYGKIWRTHTWGMTKDPAQLMAKANEYMKTGAEFRTLTLTALDMHFVDGDISMIRIGTKVHIESEPHGISLHMVCVKMDIDPDNPEKTQYTFGVKPRTLNEAVIRNERETSSLTGGGGRGGGGGKDVKDELSDILRWAKVQVDEANANILLTTGEVNKLEGRMTTAEIELDGLNASILLKAEATIVDELGQRVTSAELDIDGLNSEIALKADKIDLQGYVTMQDFEAGIADLSAAFSDSISTEYLVASTYAAFNCPISYQGDAVSKTSITVITGISGGGVNSTDTTLLTTSVGGAYTIEAGSADAVYSNGMQARFIQGEEYTAPLYEPGESVSVKKQGELFSGTLYYDGGSETITTQGGLVTGGSLYEDGGEETVTVQGSAYTTPLYVQSGGTYHRISGTLYNAGSSRTFYKRGPGHAGPLYGAGSQRTIYKRGEEYTSPLYEPGSSETIKKQGELFMGSLYHKGQEYSGGLFTNFSPATITLQDITALTS